jgi:glycosyltransferase involved in cell wall biosynthesis
MVSSLVTGLGYTFLSNSQKMRILRHFVLALYRFAINRNHAVFFQNPDDLSLFRKLSLLTNQTKTVIINGSGVDLDHYNETQLPPKISFLLVARLIREKGIVEFVNAARIVKKSHPDAHFHLVGWSDGGPSDIAKQELETWAKEGTLHYHGRVQDVRPYIAASSVYVLPSYSEGTPRTVLEAMAMGRPIITTDAPGCRETVQHGRNGYLVPVKDVNSIVDAMEEFIQNPDLVGAMGKESRRIAVNKYDVHKVNREILSALGL